MVIWRLPLIYSIKKNDESDDAASWNIGPTDPTPVSVGELIEQLGQYSERPEIVIEPSNLTETNILKLDTNKAATRLGVSSPWSTRETVRRTAEWYATFYANTGKAAATLSAQLGDYRNAL